MKLIITILNGNQKNKRFTFSNLPIAIGRLEDNELLILDPYVSRRHCLIFLNDDNVLNISDLKSTNKIKVNKNYISDSSPIKDGDLIKIGKTVLLINIK